MAQQSAQRVGSVLTLLGIRQVPAAEIQIFLAIIVLASIFSYAFPDSFATSGTLLNMARVAGIMLVVSIGQSFALIVGGFDISVGATMGLVSVVCALLMKQGIGVTEAVATRRVGWRRRRADQRHRDIDTWRYAVRDDAGHTHLRKRPCGPACKWPCDHRISSRLCALRARFLVGHTERRLYSRGCSRDRLVHPPAHSRWTLHFLDRRQPGDHAGRGRFR